MLGPQFFHLQSFSRKANKAGQSVRQVLAEAERAPEYSVHVSNPQPPNILIGMSPGEVRAAHDAMVAAGRVDVVLKDGTIAQRTVRKDRHTLMTAVASYPCQSAELLADRDKRAAYDRWAELNLRFLREMFGDKLVSVIEHLDEEHPHIHAYILPLADPGCNARDLNPAWAFKEAAEAEARAEGSEGKAAVKLGNVAYREQGKALQERYHQEVGRPSGLTRTGPKRERLSRAQWRARKAAAVKEAELEAQMNDRLASIVDREDGLEGAIAKAAEELDAEREEVAALHAAAKRVRVQAAEERRQTSAARIAQQREAAALRAAAEEEAEKITSSAQREAAAVAQEAAGIAAAEAARVAVQVIAGIVTGDVGVKPDRSGWFVRDAALRERVVALKLGDVLRDAVAAAARLWERVKAQLSAGDLAAEQRKAAEIVRDFAPKPVRPSKGMEP